MGPAFAMRPLQVPLAPRVKSGLSDHGPLVLRSRAARSVFVAIHALGTPPVDFRVQLESYHGPLDLLLHLVRKEELEVARLPLAAVTQQFLDAVAVLEQVSIDDVGDYLEIAARLIELKSRNVLPQHEEEQVEAQDPHEDLVERLLEFKRLRDASRLLEERAAQQRRRLGRVATDLADRQVDPAQQPLRSIELWDLVSAFARVMRDHLAPPEDACVRYDETPVHVLMQRIYQRLTEEDELLFDTLFPQAVHKSTLIGAFLAVLELVRHGHALAEQAGMHGEIRLRIGERPYTAATAPTPSSVDA